MIALTSSALLFLFVASAFSLGTVAYSSHISTITAVGDTDINGGVVYSFSPGVLYAHPGDKIKFVDASDDLHTMTFVVKSDLPTSSNLACGAPFPGVYQICGFNPGFPAALHFPTGGPPPGAVIPPGTVCAPTGSVVSPCFTFVANGVECTVCTSSLSSPFVLDSNKANHGRWNIGPSPSPGTPGSVISSGDSLFILPAPFVPTTEYFQIPASTPDGTVLHYMCVIHPWMQAEIIVG
ncbi:MAG: hypothetical protein OK457_03950 [Thaumarchaeota archaeon]|nr:hypothetical protein [Nitrososphaerota archaeon]